MRTSSLTPSKRPESLGSAGVPGVLPDDHARGEGPLVIEYGSYECPYCAKADEVLAGVEVRRVFRHFPVVSKHPRARLLAQAAEAAALQGKFWEMHDALMGDQAHLDDPHLWQRCESLGLDLQRFESDRRSEMVAERVQRDFRSAIRAGVTTTPSLVVDGVVHPGVPDGVLLTQLT